MKFQLPIHCPACHKTLDGSITITPSPTVGGKEKVEVNLTHKADNHIFISSDIGYAEPKPALTMGVGSGLELTEDKIKVSLSIGKSYPMPWKFLEDQYTQPLPMANSWGQEWSMPSDIAMEFRQLHQLVHELRRSNDIRSTQIADLQRHIGNQSKSLTSAHKRISELKQTLREGETCPEDPSAVALAKLNKKMDQLETKVQLSSERSLRTCRDSVSSYNNLKKRIMAAMAAINTNADILEYVRSRCSGPIGEPPIAKVSFNKPGLQD